MGKDTLGVCLAHGRDTLTRLVAISLSSLVGLGLGLALVDRWALIPTYPRLLGRELTRPYMGRAHALPSRRLNKMRLGEPCIPIKRHHAKALDKVARYRATLAT
jgi:hypothetical protein